MSAAHLSIDIAGFFALIHNSHRHPPPARNNQNQPWINEAVQAAVQLKQVDGINWNLNHTVVPSSNLDSPIQLVANKTPAHSTTGPLHRPFYPNQPNNCYTLEVLRAKDMWSCTTAFDLSSFAYPLQSVKKAGPTGKQAQTATQPVMPHPRLTNKQAAQVWAGTTQALLSHINASLHSGKVFFVCKMITAGIIGRSLAR